MIELLKKYFQKNKIVISLIVFISIGLAITLFLMGMFIVSQPEAIVSFAETSTISQEILPFSVLSLIAMLLGIVLIGLVVFLGIKMILPNKKTLEGLTMKDELGFLIDLPKRIGKEVFKNGE